MRLASSRDRAFAAGAPDFVGSGTAGHATGDAFGVDPGDPGRARFAGRVGLFAVELIVLVLRHDLLCGRGLLARLLRRDGVFHALLLRHLLLHLGRNLLCRADEVWRFGGSSFGGGRWNGCRFLYRCRLDWRRRRGLGFGDPGHGFGRGWYFQFHAARRAERRCLGGRPIIALPRHEVEDFHRRPGLLICDPSCAQQQHHRGRVERRRRQVGTGE